MKHDYLLDLDDLDLFLELNILKDFLGLEKNKPVGILDYMKGITFLPNVYIIYRIMLTISLSIV